MYISAKCISKLNRKDLMGLFDTILDYFKHRKRQQLEQEQKDAEVSNRFVDRLKATDKEINSLAIDEAKAQVEAYLSQKSFLLPEEPGVGAEVTEKLGPCLQELFGRYHKISVDNKLGRWMLCQR